MHKNSFHNKPYDFELLMQNHEPLKEFVFVNKYKTKTIDFANSKAVKALNTALLITYYKIKYWEFPDDNLCPPIPNRSDYMHHLADLLAQSNLIDNEVRVLDIGVGATCIFPLLGNALYNWKFAGSDIDRKSIRVAQKIIDRNFLANVIELRMQMEHQHILKRIIKPSDRFSASVCNPPFYKSRTEAFEATKSKLKGLGKSDDPDTRNFSGTLKELCYSGGEKAFLHNYLDESTHYKQQCFWYTSLVSRSEHVHTMEASLKKLGATEFRVLNMVRGNKASRIVAWSFLSKAEQQQWNNN